MRIRRPLFTCVIALGLAAASGCEDKKGVPKPASADADGGARGLSGVDKNIAEAVAAVAGGADAPQQGPPDTGVFAPGAADKEIRAGDMPKLTVGNPGTAPTIQFAARKIAKKITSQVEVSVQTGPRSAMPTTDLVVQFEPPPETKPAPNTPPGPEELTGKVTLSKLAADQPGQLPPGLDATVAKARGSLIQFQLGPNGAGRMAGVEPAKDMDESFDQVLRSAADALSLAFLPYPAVPVGVGAFWMVTSRESFAGLDVVVYRMIKLTKIDGDHVTLDVSAKRFVAGGKIGFPGLPPHRLVEFSGNTTGQIDVPVSNPTSVHGDVTDVLLANLLPLSPQQGQAPGQPPGQRQKLSIQIQMRTRLAVGR